MPKTQPERRRRASSLQPPLRAISSGHAFADLEFVARGNALQHPSVARGHVSMAARREGWTSRGAGPLRLHMLTDAMVFEQTGLFCVAHLVADFARCCSQLRGWRPNTRAGVPAASERVGPIRLGEPADGGVLEFYAVFVYVHLKQGSLAFLAALFQVDETTVSHTLRACMPLVAHGWVPLYYGPHAVDWDRVVRSSAPHLARLLSFLPVAEQWSLQQPGKRVAVLCVDGLEVYTGEPFDLELHRAMASPKLKYRRYGFKVLLIADVVNRPVCVTAHLHGARTAENLLISCGQCGVVPFLAAALPPDVLLLLLQDRGVRIVVPDLGAIAHQTALATPAFVQDGEQRRDRFTQREVVTSRAISGIRVSVEQSVHVLRRAGVLERFVTPRTIDMSGFAVLIAAGISRIAYCQDAQVLAFRLQAQLNGVVVCC